MNVDLLLRVKKHILQKPSRLRMSIWISRRTDTRIIKVKGREYFDFYGDSVWGDKGTQVIPSCGTIGCIAGWTCLLDDPEQTAFRGIVLKAMELLGLDHYQAEELFYITSWPHGFQDKYTNAKNQRERAKIVGQVIDDFIRRHGNDGK